MIHFQSFRIILSADHDKVGEKFLQDLGFPLEVTQFVRGHVQVEKNHDKISIKN